MEQALSRLKKSREAGYSDTQIMSFLAETRGYQGETAEGKIRNSLSAGHSTEDIVKFLYSLPKKSSPSGDLYQPSLAGPREDLARPSPYRSPFAGAGMVQAGGEDFNAWVLSRNRQKEAPLVAEAPGLIDWQKPLVPVGSWTRYILEEGLGEAESDAAKWLYAIPIASTEFFGGLTSPQNLAIIGGFAALPLILPATLATFLTTMISMYFTVEMARASIDIIPEVSVRLKEDDLQGAVEAGVHGLLSAGLAVVAGRHSWKGTKKLSEKARERFRYRKGAEDGLKGEEIKVNAERLKKIDKVDEAESKGGISEREARSKKEGIDNQYPDIVGKIKENRLEDIGRKGTAEEYLGAALGKPSSVLEGYPPGEFYPTSKFLKGPKEAPYETPYLRRSREREANIERLRQEATGTPFMGKPRSGTEEYIRSMVEGSGKRVQDLPQEVLLEAARIEEATQLIRLGEAEFRRVYEKPLRAKPFDWSQWRGDPKKLGEELRRIKLSGKDEVRKNELVGELTGETPIQKWLRGVDVTDRKIIEARASRIVAKDAEAKRAAGPSPPGGPATPELKKLLRDLRLTEVKEEMARKGIAIPHRAHAAESPNVDPFSSPKVVVGDVAVQERIGVEVKKSIESGDLAKMERSSDSVREGVKTGELSPEGGREWAEAVEAEMARNTVPKEWQRERGMLNIEKFADPASVNKELWAIAKLSVERSPKARKETVAEWDRIGQKMVERGFAKKDGIDKMRASVAKGTGRSGGEMNFAGKVVEWQLGEAARAYREYQKNPSAANALKAQREALNFSVVQQGYMGSATQASHSLNAMKKIKAMEVKLGPEKAFAHMGRLGKLNMETAEGFLRIPEKDVVGQAKYLRELHEYTSADKITAYWFANVLSATSTQVRNILGNILQGTVQIPARFISGLVDYPLSKLQRRPREHYAMEAFTATYGLFAGIPIGLRRALYIIRNGFDMRDATKIDIPGLYSFKGVLKPLNLGSRSLVAVDTIFKSMAFESELRALSFRAALKEGGKVSSLGDLKARAAEIRENPSAEMITKAKKFSELSTFTDEPDAIVRRLSRLRDVGIPKEVALVGGLKPLRFLVPFVNVPWSIVKQGVALTPVGLLRLTNKTVRNSPEASLIIGKSLLGSAVMSYMATLAATDRLTGAAPKSRPERDNFYRTGRQPFSIKIGDNWYSYKEWGPIAMPLGIAAAYYDSFNEKDEVPTIRKLQDASAVVGEMVLRGTFIGGVHDIIEAIANPVSSTAEKLLRNVASGFIPFSSLLRNISHALDPEIKDVESLYDHVRAGLPLISKGVAPRVDVFGDVLERDAEPAEVFLGIARREAFPKTEADAEFRRLKVFPALTGKSLTFRGKKIELTTEERREYKKIRGEELKEALKDVTSGRRYMLGGDGFKRAFLKRIMEKAQLKSRRIMKRIISSKPGFENRPSY
jgi:hypothetical protein